MDKSANTVAHVRVPRSAGSRACTTVALLALFAGGCTSGASTSTLRPSGTLPVESGLATTVGTQTLVDTGHTTAANGTFPELPSRTLVTTIVSPTGQRGPFPLVVFSHGFTATPADYLPLLRQWAAAGSGLAAYHDAHPPKFFVTLNGSGHSDPYLGDSTKADEVVTTATIDFFDHYLKGSPVALQRLQRDANIPGTASLQDTRT